MPIERLQNSGPCFGKRVKVLVMWKSRGFDTIFVALPRLSLQSHMEA
jgi:hypothetical protein